MPRPVRLFVSIGLLTLAVVVGSGCLAVGAGVAGGAVAGYCYYRGKLAQRYGASFADTLAATRATLPELGLTIVEETREPSCTWLEARTATGERVQVFVEPQSPPLDGTGQLTQVSVRVGTFGDSPLSEKILEQVGRHLRPGTPLQPVAAPPPTGSPPQTAPPPLLPAEPAPKS